MAHLRSNTVAIGDVLSLGGSGTRSTNGTSSRGHPRQTSLLLLHVHGAQRRPRTATNIKENMLSLYSVAAAHSDRSTNCRSSSCRRARCVSKKFEQPQAMFVCRLLQTGERREKSTGMFFLYTYCEPTRRSHTDIATAANPSDTT
jgi:hypothetical protein